jgi:hypothetical protein
VKAVEIPLAGVSPRFAAAYGSNLDGCDRDATTRRRAWFAIQPALYQRLQSLLDDGWEIVPRTLGPHSLRIAVQRESHLAALPFRDWFMRQNKRYVSSATVLLQRPVHPEEERP